MSDSRGLLLSVNPSGAKYWMFRIRRNGEEIRRGLGKYPNISLEEARAKAAEMKTDGDFSSCRNAKGITFNEVFMRYHKKRSNDLSEVYLIKLMQRFKKYIEPEFGKMRMTDIKPKDVLNLCENISYLGYNETAHRVKNIISCVFCCAVIENIASSNPAADLGHAGVLKQPFRLNYAAITEPKRIGDLMRAISEYPYPLVRNALNFSAHTFCRPGEIRKAEWREVDFHEKLWIIPAAKMKMRKDHIGPLSKQTAEILSEIRELTGSGKYIFPSARSSDRSLSADTVRIALRLMGFTKEEMTTHGFRSMASTMLNYYEWNKDIIEAQLAHIDGTVRGVYNRTLYLPQRRAMMQWWSDALDALRDNMEVPKKPMNIMTATGNRVAREGAKTRALFFYCMADIERQLASG